MRKILLVLMLLLVVGCTTINPEKACTVDEDCMPSDCCHATEAVHKNYGPDCEGVLCTAVCEPGTLDCGQGEVKCVARTCKVVLDN